MEPIPSLYSKYPPLTSADKGEIGAALMTQLTTDEWKRTGARLLFEIGRLEALLFNTRRYLAADDISKRAADPELDKLCTEIEAALGGWTNPPAPPLDLPYE